MNPSGHEPKVAVVGATGVVGSQIVDLLETRQFPCSELSLFGSEPGSSRNIEPEGSLRTDGGSRSIVPLTSPDELGSFDIAFLAVAESVAASIIDARPGPTLIDLSAATRAPSAVPLVAPGLNTREQVENLKAERVFAVPHPGAQALGLLLSALDVRSGFVGALVVTAASSEGGESITELFNQSADLLNARLDVDEDETQLAFNLFIPEDGRELARVVGAQVTTMMKRAPGLSIQIIRAPIFHGGAAALFVPSSGGANVAEWPKRLREAPGIILVDENDSMSLTNAIGQEAILVRMNSTPAGAAFWCAYDSARLAAMTAVWIAEGLSFLAV